MQWPEMDSSGWEMLGRKTSIMMVTYGAVISWLGTADLK